MTGKDAPVPNGEPKGKPGLLDGENTAGNVVPGSTGTTDQLIKLFLGFDNQLREAQDEVSNIAWNRAGIVAELAKGFTYREVGEMLGLTPARVGQLVNKYAEG